MNAPIEMTVYVERTPGGRIALRSGNGAFLTACEESAAEQYGIPVPPPLPRTVTLSIGDCEVEVSEVDVRTIARIGVPYPDSAVTRIDVALNAACRAWVAANPEGGQS
mgnify:CR=1 FL=1